MSGVFQRNKHLSSFEFYNTAIEIYYEVTKLVSSENIVPKRRRFLNAMPAVEAARSLIYNINRSDSFYPNNARNAYQRKKYLSLALADCEQLCIDLQCILNMKPDIKVFRFQVLADLLEKEKALLKSMRKGVRIIGEESIEDKIIDAEEELSVLHAL